MFALAARLRGFQSPRVTLVLLLIGFSGQWIVQRHVRATASRSARAIASVDSAIARALPAVNDASGTADARMRSLVSRKRDLEVEAERASEPWYYAFALSNGLMLAAAVVAAQALVAHLRDRE